ncbi:DUF1403 family protein [Amaricoccus solimangrovi]|uniref:DUF1403 family protein n=1 Tax=Amaricoccus solimangrovi TaxID=2589815 RepID=A0A501WFP0_9RHOB|nr:DUF1403 family protein [Amaricoccus solimangrovi]TPE46904.1 DUF1403 family protein [Amaricoccus solimangrovi]
MEGSIEPLDLAETGVAAPRWSRPEPSEDLETLAFRAGGALAALHPLVARPREDMPAALLRDRLALAAAEASARFAGRPERAAELRDEIHLARPGDRPGPAGAVFDLWRRAVRIRLDGRWRDRLGGLLPEAQAPILAEAGAAAGPVTAAFRALEAALEAAPRDETPALILADAVLTRALGWDHAVPLLATGLKRADLRAGGAGLERACHRAAALAALDALSLASELARRAARLRAATPKLRAKGAQEAARLFLSEDALAPGIALSPVIRLSAARMTDRAARRLCDRLVTLGLVRELTGRPSFRIYGL